MSTTRALDLPEVLYRVGQFLPLWTHQDEEEPDELYYVFLPRTIVTCLRVSKLWHRTLLPILWHTYSAGPMWMVPLSVLKRNSVHFKILRALLFEPDVFQCTSLVDLAIPQQLLEIDAQRQLVRTNPGLRILRWHGPHKKVLIEADDFVHLTKIHTLELAHWEGSGGALGRVLGAVAGSLVNLELGWIQEMANRGLTADTSSIPQNKTNEGLILGHLESFTSVNRQTGGLDPTEFIHCCPNLKSCDLTLTTDIDVIRLSDTLAKHCPKLDALTISEYRRLQLCETLLQDLGGRQMHNLVHLKVSQIALTKSLISFITLHASGLESLSISVQDVDDYNLIDSAMGVAFLPLHRCYRLKTFSIVISSRHIFSRTILRGLHVDQWGCKDLEQLSLEFLPPPTEGRWSSWTTAKNSFKDCGGVLKGWKISSKEDAERTDAYSLQVRKEFFRDLFEAVRRLENLRAIKWNKIVFSRVE